MQRRVLIVEDEILVALDLEWRLNDMGAEVVAIAADRKDALAYAEKVDLALVDVNLRDGATGPDIGRELASRYGVAVVFVTANPAQIGSGLEGAIGVMTKPFTCKSLGAMMDYVDQRTEARGEHPPVFH